MHKINGQRSRSFTSLRQMDYRLFNHSVHLSRTLGAKFAEHPFYAAGRIPPAGRLLRYQRTVSPIASFSGVACSPNACPNLE
jgi:hypothetical protein